MAYNPSNLFDKIFKNKKGKVVIWQNANIPLWAWIATKVLAFIFKHGRPHNGLQTLGGALLVTWAYLEIRYGESLFRKVLGSIVLLLTVYGFFKK